MFVRSHLIFFLFVPLLFSSYAVFSRSSTRSYFRGIGGNFSVILLGHAVGNLVFYLELSVCSKTIPSTRQIDELDESGIQKVGTEMVSEVTLSSLLNQYTGWGSTSANLRSVKTW